MTNRALHIYSRSMADRILHSADAGVPEGWCWGWLADSVVRMSMTASRNKVLCPALGVNESKPRVRQMRIVRDLEGLVLRLDASATVPYVNARPSILFLHRAL